MDVVFQLESNDVFQMVTKDIISNLHKPGQVVNSEVESNITDSAKDYLRKLIIKYNFDISDVVASFKASNWDQNRVEYFISMLNEKKTNVLQSIITHHNSSYADTVTDFDWSLKLVFGSSECKGLRYPLLQVMLSSLNSSGDQKQRLYEMNKETLSKLIKTLEDYQKKHDE